jgi:hypothetical protein
VSTFLAEVRAGMKPGWLVSKLLAVFHNFIGAAWDPAGGDVRGDVAPPSREEMDRLARAVVGDAEPRRRSRPAERPPNPTPDRFRDPEELVRDHERGRHTDEQDGPSDDCGLCD